MITGDPDVDRALSTDMTVDITTTGRASGRPSRIEIWVLNVDGRIFITGTPGPRDWYANLQADQALTFHLKESMRADLPARAHVVNDRAIRQLVFEHPSAAWYRSQTPVDELIATAPMVEITFEPASATVTTEGRRRRRSALGDNTDGGPESAVGPGSESPG